MPLNKVDAYEVRCDKCQSVLFDSEYYHVFPTENYALETAAEEGWTTDNKTFICTDCRKKLLL